MQLPVPALPEGRSTFDAVSLGLNASDHLIVVPQFPTFNSKIEFRSHQLLFGGQAATAMVACARLGFKARYIGRVGSDDVGRLQIESLKSEGVDLSECRVVPGVDSQIAYILVDESSGERTVIWKRDPRISVHPSDISQEMICSGRVLLLDGHNIEAEILAATWARAAGIPVVIDVDKDYGGERLYPLIDYLITSEEFPHRVTGITDQREALVALQHRYGCPFVAATLGSRGVLAYCDGQWFESSGFHVDAKDTTGAGDAFHGGFIAAMLEGASIDGALHMANAVAALNCTRLGARGGLPTRAELNAFLAERT